MSDNVRFTKQDLELIDKILTPSLRNNIYDQLRNTENKLKVIDNRRGEIEDLPHGFTIEIYNKNDQLIMQTCQDGITV